MAHTRAFSQTYLLAVQVYVALAVEFQHRLGYFRLATLRSKHAKWGVRLGSTRCAAGTVAVRHAVSRTVVTLMRSCGSDCSHRYSRQKSKNSRADVPTRLRPPPVLLSSSADIMPGTARCALLESPTGRAVNRTTAQQRCPHALIPAACSEVTCWMQPHLGKVLSSSEHHKKLRNVTRWQRDPCARVTNHKRAKSLFLHAPSRRCHGRREFRASHKGGGGGARGSGRWLSGGC